MGHSGACALGPNRGADQSRLLSAFRPASRAGQGFLISAVWAFGPHEAL